MLVDHLAVRWGFGSFHRDGPARVARGMFHRREVQLVKPQTFMNRSGSILGPLRTDRAFDVQRELLIVVDEVQLDLGRFRLRSRGTAGGHNGLKSIEGALGHTDYARLRIGVGPVPQNYPDMADFVLDPFRRDERAVIEDLLDPVAEAVETWVTDGIDIAMTRHNKKPPTPESEGS